MQDFFVSINYDGSVTWLAPVVVKTVCNFNVRYFPYDTQFCTLTVGSWMFDGLEVDLWNKREIGWFIVFIALTLIFLVSLAKTYSEGNIFVAQIHYNNTVI